MSARELITDHLDLWTGAVTTKSTAGRGGSSGKRGKIELTGIKKLRELILELAVRGKLVEQDPSDEPASVLLERIAEEKARLVKEGKIKKPKKLPDISEEEKPFELPEGWQWARLSDVLRVINGRAYKKHEMLQEGTPLLRVGNLFTSNEWYYSDLQLEDDKYIDHGDLIYAWSASFGPFIWNGERAIYHYHIWKLELFDRLSTDKHFLYNYLKAVTEEIKSSGSGIAMVHMTKAKMEELVVPLPPWEEQHRIVKKVDELMALCDRLEQQVGDQLEAHEVLVDTLLGSLFKPAEGSLTRSTDAAEVSENWARIAEHFDTLFTTEASIDKLKQAILQLAVMGRLVEQDPNDEPASVLVEKLKDERVKSAKKGKGAERDSTSPETEQLHQIPKTWIFCRVSDAGEIKLGRQRSPKDHTGPNMTPYLRVANVLENKIDTTDIKEMNFTESEREIFSLAPGDILLNEGQSRELVGRPAIYKGEVPGACFQNTLLRFRAYNGVTPEYANKVFLSYLHNGRFQRAATQTTNIAHLSAGRLAPIEFPLPPLSEQHRIVEKVDDLMTLCDQLKIRLAEAGATRTHLAEAVVEQAVN